MPTGDELIAEYRRKEIAQLRRWRIVSVLLATVPWCIVLLVDYVVGKPSDPVRGTGSYFVSRLLLPVCVTLGIVPLVCSDSRLRQGVGHLVGFIWPFLLHLRFENRAWPTDWDRSGAMPLATMCLFLGVFAARSVNGFLADRQGVFGRAIQFPLKDLFVLTTYAALVAATLRAM